MHLTYVALHEVTWCMVVWYTERAETAAVSCDTSHASAASTPLIETHYKKLFTHVESHASALSLLESGE